MTEDEQNEKRLDVSIQIRNLEIDLFWKRSLFFWGFIASAFIGYAALRNQQSDLAIVVACFGMVCSCAWALLNRGSKYWQENWEIKVERFEIAVTGILFGKEEPEQLYKGPWLRARKYSVSKLAVALSDYVFVLWLAIVISEVVRRYVPGVNPCLKQIGIIVFTAFSLVYVFLLFVYGRKTPRPPSNGK